MPPDSRAPGLDRPEVVAHRGASDIAAEHTLGAYRRAIEDGADALECDVRLTRDGVLVCVHDRKVDRTSDGHGVVSALELADLAELDFASWHATHSGGAAEAPDVEGPDVEGPDVGADGARENSRVLTLERLLETVADAGRVVDVAIETKHPTRYAGLVELTLVDVLTRFGLHRPDSDGRSRARVMSFSAAGLRRMRSLAPAVPSVYLMQRIPLRLRDGELPRSATAVGPSLRALRAFPGYVERAHDHGVPVHVWTVDEPSDVAFVAGLGVDVVITNRPAAVLRQLAAIG